MATLQTPSLARWIQCLELRRERLREAIPTWLSELPALSPRATSWADVAASDQDPDVFVRRDGETLAVELNARGLPEGFDVAAETDAGDAMALAEGYAKVGTLIVGITKAILAREHAFFLQDGPRAAMFRERDIGEDLGSFDVSSRAGRRASTSTTERRRPREREDATMIPCRRPNEQLAPRLESRAASRSSASRRWTPP